MIQQFAIGLLLSGIIGLVACRRGSLSRSGVLGAVITGTLIFGLGGLVPGLLLVAFFVSSSVLSHFRGGVKAGLADKFQKGSQRDLGQALANGGWAALLIILLSLVHSPILFAAFAGALASATADTWATELGVLSSRPPRLVTTGQAVPAGTSGGVTALGTLSAFLGAGFIGLLAAMLLAFASPFPLLLPETLQAISALPAWVALALAATIGGLAGALFDSLLGAAVQAVYFCPRCGKETERPVHSCGTRTVLAHGWRWLDNDAVNFIASVLASAVAALIWVAARGV